MKVERLNTILLSVFLLGGLLLSIAMALVLPTTTLVSLTRENGPVEMASAALHFLVAACLLGLWLRVGRPFGLLAFFAALLGLREMDMHNALTTESITKTSFYLGDHVPLSEKLLVGAAVIALMIATVRFLITYWRSFLEALRKRHPAAVSLTVGIALFPILKSIDALPRLVRRHLDYDRQTEMNLLLRSVEETMEMFSPLVFLTAVVSFYLMHHAARTSKGFSRRHGP